MSYNPYFTPTNILDILFHIYRSGTLISYLLLFPARPPAPRWNRHRTLSCGRSRRPQRPCRRPRTRPTPVPAPPAPPTPRRPLRLRSRWRPCSNPRCLCGSNPRPGGAPCCTRRRPPSLRRRWGECTWRGQSWSKSEYFFYSFLSFLIQFQTNKSFDRLTWENTWRTRTIKWDR